MNELLDQRRFVSLKPTFRKPAIHWVRRRLVLDEDVQLRQMVGTD